MANAASFGQLGRVVAGRYRLVASLGSGASAQVYLADDVTLGRQVAVKMLQPALAADERFLEHFRAEARTVASVNHPNIVVVHDSGVDEVPFLVTEFLAGGSLRGMLAAGHRLTPSQALVVGLEAARGLAHAHGKGLVHRDLKPANLLFGEDARLRIADFGLARAIAETGLTEHDGSLVGTLRYVAPEQAQGRVVGPPADVYALALVLVEAVSGQVPFAGPDPAAMLTARTLADLSVPDELGPLRPALERAGRVDPDERADAEEFGIALLAASERLPPPDPLPLVGALAEAGAEESADERTTVAPSAVSDPTGVANEVLPTETVGDGGGHRRRWLVLSAIAAVVAVVAGAFGLYQVLRTPTTPVPDLVGAPIESLEAVAVEHDWVLDVKKTRVDGTDPGEIVSIDPPPGDEAADGATLVVLVSEGNTLTDRPADLVDRPLEEVILELDQAGLDHSVTEVFDEDIPAGNVIGTDGDVDAELPRGEIVPLLVSKGPAPRTVPPFAPEDGYDAVAAALEDVQLVAVRAEVFSDDVPAGVVISLDPAPGAEVPRDSEVTVTVSKGPDVVEVPDLRGLTLDQAEKKLIEAGLVLGQDCCASRGRVIGSDPGAGQMVRRGTAVNVFLAR